MSNTLPAIKIGDARRRLSVAVVQKRTSHIEIPTAAPIGVIIYPGFLNSITYSVNGAINSFPAPYPGSETYVNFEGWMSYPPKNMKRFKSVRVTACAARLKVLNADVDNDGYWEAGRWIPTDRDIKPADYYTEAVPPGFAYPEEIQMADWPTFQHGNLDSLEKYEFSLNSIQDEHLYTNQHTTFSPDEHIVSTTMLYDKAWDAIQLKIYGTRGTTTNVTPAFTRIQYEIVTHFEVVYNQQDIGARFHSQNVLDPEWKETLNSRNRIPPGSLLKD
jgi:hypothetical protein